MNYERQNNIIPSPESDLKLPVRNNSKFIYNNKAKELVLDIVFNTNNDGNKPKEFNLTFPDPLHIPKKKLIKQRSGTYQSVQMALD